MAKTIKFNLKCNGQTVRTPEDLQENFDLDDVLFYYRKNLLKRWLEVRGFSEQAEKVENIKAEDDMEIAATLMEIFGMEKDDTALASIRLHKEWETLCDRKREKIAQMKTTIAAYVEAYQNLTEELADTTKTPGEVKACIKEIADNYYEVLKQDHRRLFWELVSTAPQSILCMLMNEKTRDFYLPVEIGAPIYGDVPLSDQIRRQDQVKIYQKVCSIIEDTSLLHTLVERGFVKAIDGESITDIWIPLHTGKAMVLKLSTQSRIRPEGSSDSDAIIGAAQIKDKFVLLSNTEFYPNSADATPIVYYMEV